jgi:glutaredoxin
VSVETPRRAVQVTLVHSPACHFCEDAEEALRELSKGYPIDLSVVDIRSAAGAGLVAQHRPAMNPLVLVDGEFFSSGRLPRKKLLALMERRRSAAEPPVGAER